MSRLMTSVGKVFQLASRKSRSHRAAASVARPCFRPAVKQLDQRLLLSATSVTPTLGSPLARVVELQVTYPDGRTAVGSGAMIDRSHVLTAAHVLYSATDGGYATSVTAMPGEQQGSAPFGVAYGIKERVDPSWIHYSASHAGGTSPAVADVGLVTLNWAIGDTTGWFPVSYATDPSFFKGRSFETAGYARVPEMNGEQMVESSGKSLGALSKFGIGFRQSDLEAMPGVSGGPVWYVNCHHTPVLYGLVTGTNGFTSSSDVYAFRITQPVLNEIRAWQKADGAATAVPDEFFAQPLIIQHPLVPAAQLKLTPSPVPAIRALDDYVSYDDSSGYSLYDPSSSYYDSYSLTGNDGYNGPQFVAPYPTNPQPNYSNPMVDGIAQGNAMFFQWAYNFYSYYTGLNSFLGYFGY